MYSDNPNFIVGDRVRIEGRASYDSERYPESGEGTIIRVRARYQNTRFAYRQYQVWVDGTDRPKEGDLTYYYEHVSKTPVRPHVVGPPQLPSPPELSHEE